MILGLLMIESRTIVRFALNYVVVFDKYCEWGSFPTPANRNLALGKLMASWVIGSNHWRVIVNLFHASTSYFRYVTIFKKKNVPFVSSVANNTIVIYHLYKLYLNLQICSLFNILTFFWYQLECSKIYA